MNKEQLNIFYDLEKMETITAQVAAVNNNSDLTAEEKASKVTEIIETLDDEDKREFLSYVRTVQTETRDPFQTRFCGRKQDKDKVVLMEFSNIQYSYCQTVAFLGMISYMMTRADQYKGESREHIHAFMNEVFGGHSDKYVSTLYDLFYKDNKASHPTHVPEVDPEVFGEYMPSFDQWNNYIKYCNAKFHELRALTSGLMGFRPSHDAILHVHGMFDSATDPELIKYRNANYMKIDPMNELLVVPVGETKLVDQYVDYRSGVVLFDPSNPDLEIMHTNRIKTNMNEHAMFKKKISNLEGRMSKDELVKIKKYQTELRKLQNTPIDKRTQLQSHKIDTIKRKIDTIHESHVSDSEVITKVITLGKEVKVETCAAPDEKA